MKKKLNIALIVGGVSTEREVSKLSGKGVYNALRNLNYNVKVIDPALGIDQLKNDNEYFGADENLILNSSNYIKCIDSNLFNNIDTAFNALHGKWGEDGIIQSLFELRGINYTGAGVLASSISMNKGFSKVMFRHYDVTTPDWIVVNINGEEITQIEKKIESQLGFPCVIKPNDQGSAIGLTICNERKNLVDAIHEASKYSKTILVEKFIDGYELTVGILDNHAFPVLEIKPKHNFYDYTCKYTHGMSEYEVPAKFPGEVLELIQNQALLAYNSVGCTSYGRLDFRLSNDLKPFCLEVNTLPGLTSTSLLPKTAKAENISYEDLVDRIIWNSLK